MFEYKLGPHIHHCHLDEGLVILDIRTQKYLALPPDYRRAFHLSTNRTSDGYTESDCQPDGDALKSLLEAKILVPPGAAGRPAVPANLQATASMMDTAFTGGRPIIRPGDTLIFLRAALMSAYKLKWTNLEHVLDGIKESKSLLSKNRVEFTTDGARVLFEAFRWHRLWTYSAAGQCLFDSLALTLFLQRKRLPATFVMGVRSKPFSAHAWVQWKGTVVNDNLEHVQRYTPILAI